MTLYETIELDYPQNSVKYLYLRLIAIVVIVLGIFLANTKRHSNIDVILANTGFVFLMAGVIIFLVSFFIAKPSKEALEEYWEILAREKEIRNNILVLSEFNSDQHQIIETLNSEGYTQRGTMWQVYRRADLMEADAIIINSSNVATHTHVSTSITNGSISTSSTNTDKFYITATLVKYKNSRNKPLTTVQQTQKNSLIEAIYTLNPKKFPREMLEDKSLSDLEEAIEYLTQEYERKTANFIRETIHKTDMKIEYEIIVTDHIKRKRGEKWICVQTYYNNIANHHFLWMNELEIKKLEEENNSFRNSLENCK